MRLDKGSMKLSSWVGTLCSCFLFLLIGAYAVQKLDILVNKREVDLIYMTASNALTYTDKFDSSMGFNIAAAFTAYDDETEPIDDPTVGSVVFNHYKWGENSDGSLYAGRYLIKSHRCTRKELGLDRDSDDQESNMFPMEANFDRDIELYHKKFFCPDQEDLRIFGDFNTIKAQLFNV